MECQVWVTIDDNEVIDYVKRNKRPEDVFTDEELSEWALSNGFDYYTYYKAVITNE